ncbi:MAG: hypothetical protein KBT27_16330, partial [Prevotellaceae bacterium]|nr:hypothetical protein [Candidatus Faecinaster equi]
IKNMEKAIQDGKYYLSGIDEFSIDDKEGYYIVLNNEVFAIEYDYTDGYRSYGSIYKDAEGTKVRNRFIPQLVGVINTENHDPDECIDYKGVDIINIESGEIIFRIGTDYNDSYYPIATMEYHPENLPINVERANTSVVSMNVEPCNLTDEEIDSLQCEIVNLLLKRGLKPRGAINLN